MKKLMILIIFLMSGILSFGQVRPPIVTNEIQTSKLVWNTLEMQRDSIPYWIPINERSFTLHNPTNTVSQTYNIPSNQIFAVTEDGDTITLIDGGTYERNDSVFHIRRSPFCSICWDYSYNYVDWELLFCEQVATGRILIGENAQKVLEMSYDLNIENWRDKIYFKIDTPTVGKKVIMLDGDSVDWQSVPVDSIFVTNLNKWVYGSDTMTINMDSLFFYDQKWHNRKDTLIVNSDSLYFVNFSKYFSNKDTIPLIDTTKWQYDDNGIHVGGAKSIGLNCDADEYRRLTIQSKTNDLIGLSISGGGYAAAYLTNSGDFTLHANNEDDGTAVYATSHSGIGGYFNGSPGLSANSAIIDGNFKVGATGKTITRTGTMAEKDSLGVNQLYDVSISSPVTDQILKYNGSKWVNGTASGGSSQWTTDTYGITYANSVGIGISSASSYKLNVYSTTTAICGSAKNKGVLGFSSSGHGIEGQTSNGYGVYGLASGSGSGVVGSSDTGWGGFFMKGVYISSGDLSILAGGIKLSGTERISNSGVFTPSNGVSGSFTTANGKTVTVTNGIITQIQ